MPSLRSLFSRSRPPAALPGRGRDRSLLPKAVQNRTFSYYANRSQTDYNLGREAVASKPPLRHLPGRIERLRRHFGWLLVIVIAVGGLSYELQLSTQPSVVSTVQAADAPFLRPSRVYAQAASKLLISSAANRNKLTVDATGIAAALKRQFPELEDVAVSLPLLGDQPVIYIKPATPAVVLANSNGSFVLDDSGRVVARLAGQQSTAVHAPVIRDASGLAVSVGHQILPKSVVSFISTLSQQLKAQSVTVGSLSLPAAASELDANIQGRPYIVKFNLHAASAESAQLQAGSYVAVSKQLDGQGITPKQYVDVRLQGRVYYQ